MLIMRAGGVSRVCCGSVSGFRIFLSQADYQAGRCTLHSLDLLNSVGDRPAELVEVIRFKKGNHVKRACYGIN
jgi:hypothetical protein